MNISPITLKNSTILAIALFVTFAISVGPAAAGAHMMKSNLSDIADQLSEWSKQSGKAKMTPEAQKMLSELLAEASQIIKEMAGEDGGKMEMEHKTKIEKMKKTYDSFDWDVGE